MKAVGDVGCPLGGIVQAVNEQLLDKPGIVNSSPEDEGRKHLGCLYSFLGNVIIILVIWIVRSLKVCAHSV